MVCRTRLAALLAPLPAALALTAACSGSSRPVAEAPEAGETREPSAAEKLWAEKPAEPYERQVRRGFRAAERCGQGPYRVEASALSSRYGEKLTVYACGPREIAGDYRFAVHRPGREVDETVRSFGSRRSNEACVASQGELVRAGSGGGGSAGGHGAAGGGGGAAAPSPAPAEALEEVTEVPESCTALVHILGHGWETSGGIMLEPGTRFTLDVWSSQPNDLDGVQLVIEQFGVRDDMTDEAWAAYQEASRRWYERYQALVEEETRAGRWKTVDLTAKAPPPPAKKEETPPPRPSVNARWVPGYWHHEDGAFHWIAGFWRVPESDRLAKRTVRAPAAPPQPRQEAPPPRPARAAVWAAGHWQWSGRAWVWVPGAWRIPPSRRHGWTPDRWVITGGGAVFAPGGWRIQIGR